MNFVPTNTGARSWMADVFISYARRNAAIAEQVVNALSEAGLTVFRDVDVSIGESWADRLVHEIRAAKCVLALWTPESCQSMDVQWERRKPLGSAYCCR